MRIDAYTHFFPKKFFDRMLESAGDYKDMGKRVRAVPALFDLDHRKKIVDMFPDYAQILSYPQPPLELLTKLGEVDELSRMINDGFAELCAKHHDHFPGFVAQVSLAAPDAGVREAERAIKELGALGVQIYTNVAGKPIDLPEYEGFWAKMNDLGKPIWMHPARGADVSDYPSCEKKFLRNSWGAFGWSLRDRLRHGAAGVLQDARQIHQAQDHRASFRRHRADARRPHRQRLDQPRHPHHRRGLCGAAQQPQEASARPCFKNDLCADTSAFGGIPATKCGMEFYPADKDVLASDCPRSIPRSGIRLYIRDAENFRRARYTPGPSAR